MEQRDAFGRSVRKLCDPDDLIEKLTRTRHVEERFERHLRHGCDKRQLERANTSGDTQIGDGFVQETDNLANVGLTVTKMRRWPLDERRPGLHGGLQRRGLIRAEGDFVEHPRDLAAETRKICLTAHGGILLVSRGRGVTIRAWPIDRRGRNRDEMESWLLVGAADRHRKDDTVVEPRELAVTHERRAVREENATQRRCRRGRERAPSRQAARRAPPTSSSREDRDALYNPRPVCRRTTRERRLWKKCGWHVQNLLRT